MASSIDHYLTAQELLTTAEARRVDAYAQHDPGEERNRLMRLHASLVAEANAHATLALAAVTAIRINGEEGLPREDFCAWERTASVAAPIPAETEDESFPLTAAEAARWPALASTVRAVGVGSVSPTDPDELGEWLRDRPDGTILRGAKGLGWQLNVVAVTSFLVNPFTYRALTSMSGEEFRIAENSPDIDKLVIAAPFTVLALGNNEPEDGAQ